MAEASANPFGNIGMVENSQELLDLAFSKAMNIRPPSGRGSSYSRSKNHELNRINTAANVLVDRIERIVRQFPSIDRIHPFYQEMCDLHLGVDQIKISLGRVHGITKHIRGIQEDINTDMATSSHKSENKQIRKRAFGRLSSIVYQLSDHLSILKKAGEKLSNLPGFDPKIPTIVITGVPNAGKSSFIREYTSGRPEIAAYPFTTKEVSFGHRELDFLNIQFVDTPGLLDRTLMERNDVELQALLALKYLTDIMVFFFDPTENASCSATEQLHLLGEIREFYPSLSFLVVITKVDLIDQARVNELKEAISDNTLLDFSEILTVSNTKKGEADDFISRLEEITKKLLLKSRKFRYLTYPEIAEDQLPEEHDPMWDDWYYSDNT